MLNLKSLWHMRASSPPASNDPHMQIHYYEVIWRQRNNLAFGRAVMAWAAITGWACAACLALI